MRQTFRAVIRAVIVVSLAFAPGATIAQSDRAAEAQLKAAIQIEEVDRNIQEAIKQYKQLAGGNDRAIAAKALLRLAECYRKIGDAQSTQVYETIIKNFADQKEAAAEARTRLAALAALTIGPRVIFRNCDYDDASVTADGKYLAINDWDASDIALRDLSTGRIIPLRATAGTTPSDSVSAQHPVVSPDGKDVAFNWLATPNRGRHEELRVMPNQAGAKASVLLTADDATIVPRGWSGDGGSVLAVLAARDRTKRIVWVSVADRKVTEVASLGTRLDSWNDVSLSPDGRYVAFSALATNAAPTSASQDRRVYVIPAAGGTPVELFTMAGRSSTPVWMPDGRHVLFFHDQGRIWGLWAVSVANGRAAGTPVPVRPAFEGSLIGVTRSGTLYYDRAHSPGTASVEVAQLGTSGQVIETSQTMTGSNPSWSPDGKWIAFVRARPRSQNFDLVIRSTDSRDEKVISRDGLPEFAPVWFRSNSAVLMPIVNRTPGSAGWFWFSVDIRTGEFTEIRSLAGVRSPSFGLSPDGTTLFVSPFLPPGATARSVVSIDLASGQRKDAYTATGAGESIHNWISLSPDGRSLAVLVRDATTRTRRLARVNLDGSGYKDLDTIAEPGGFSWPVWSGDSRFVYYGKCTDTCNAGSRTQSSVMRIAADGGTAEFTGVVTRAQYPAFAVSPDGSRLAHTTMTPASAELLALDNVSTLLKQGR